MTDIKLTWMVHKVNLMRRTKVEPVNGRVVKVLKGFCCAYKNTQIRDLKMLGYEECDHKKVPPMYKKELKASLLS